MRDLLNMIDEQVKAILDQIPDPQVNEDHKQKLLITLAAELPRPKTWIQRLKEWYPFALLQSQIRIIRGEIWWASALILILGVIVTLVMESPDGALFVALAPIVAAVGLSLLYDHTIQMMLEIEETTRASSRQLLLARLTLVFGFNLVLAFGGSFILSILGEGIMLWPLILSWLAPMSFLSGLAFLLSVLTVDTLAPVVFSLFLWVCHLLFKDITAGTDWMYWLSFPGFVDPDFRPLMITLAGLLVMVALWIVGVQERRFGRYHS